MSHRKRGLLALLGVLVLAGFSAAPDLGKRTSPASLTTPQAIVLGIVEGVTEYLPISSTGHLLITEKALDLGQTPSEKDATDSYTVVIQIGAILAVLGIFLRRFALMIQGLAGRSIEGRNLVVSLALAFIPSVVVALAFEDPIKERLLEPWPVVVAWAFWGAFILFFAARQSGLRVRFSSLGSIPWTVALAIGAAQALALWPGTSRSLVTIVAALSLGVGLTAAVEFSFLLGFLTLSAATAYELLKNGSTLVDQFGVMNPVIGIVVAGIAAFVSVKWMITYLEKHSLRVFGWYRLGVAGLTALLLATGAI